MNSLYSKKVLKHFRHPRNMGKMKKPDGVATVGNPVCGDVMKLYIRVAKEQSGKGTEFIKEIKFQTLGCGAAIATSSILTEMAKGKPLTAASKITNQAITEALDGLPPAKRHCSILAAKALQKAIANYRRNR